MTSCEALWMGVPVVTLAGYPLVSRQSASLLMNFGKAEWVSESPRQYVETALELAANPVELARQRHGLREILRASAVCKAPDFTRDLEEIFREMRS